MPCYRQIPALRSPDGGRPIILKNPSQQQKQSDNYIMVPCGRCIGCRLDKSSEWALRCVHEMKQWENNCFITLTFDDEHIRPDGSLDKRDFVLFMKKLRRKYGPNIRFFHCGEYGEKNGRPHHHAILFNHKFTDAKISEEQSNLSDVEYLESDDLSRIWPYGRHIISDANYETAAYIARYTVKGTKSKRLYGEKLTGFLAGREPEQLTMSRNPGIGFGRFEEYCTEWIRRGSCRENSRDQPIPRYYIKKIKEKDEEMYEKFMVERREKALASGMNEENRKYTKEKFLQRHTKKLVRSLEK